MAKRQCNSFGRERRALERWQPFRDFERLTEQLIDELDDDFLVGHYQWLREAKIACMFGNISRATQTRLAADDRQKPDFVCIFGQGSHLRFQVVEVLPPDRKRSLEITRWIEAGRPQLFSQGELSDNRDVISQTLGRVFREKAAIPYPRGTSLLLYFNIATYGRWDEYVEQTCIEASQLARVRFASIWVLWGPRLLRCWPQPFLGDRGAFRPGKHVLGSSIRAYKNKRMLDELYASNRVSQ